MFRMSETIRSTATPDGAVLLDVHHGRMFCLNVVGARILELLQQGYDEAHIAEDISRKYGISVETVRADVAEFLASLEKHHILQGGRGAQVT